MKILYRLSKEPEELMCDLINHTNNTNFDISHFNFSTPFFNPSTGRCSLTVTPKELSNINGKMLSGNVPVDYKRINLTYFFASRALILLIPEESTDNGQVTEQLILDELLKQKGLFFRLDEIYVSFIKQQDPEDPEKERTYFTITPKPTHLVWEGTLVGEYVIAFHTSNFITQTSLDGLNNPLGLSESTFPLEYLYFGKIDGTVYKHVLKELEEGHVFNEQNEDSLWHLGQNLTGDVWSYIDSPTETYNIYNAVVEYNGVNDGEWGTDQDSFNKVLVIRLDDNYNLKVAGRLVIPYID